MTHTATTALFPFHQELHALIVDFAGWQMPLHYGSQLKEHQQVREDSGLFDVSHMLCIDCQGPQATEFLRVLLANDVAKCPVGKALYSCMLTPQGGVLDDLIVYHLAENRYRLVVNAGTADKDLAFIQQQAKAFNVTITSRRELSILSIQGPKSLERLQAVLDPSVYQTVSTIKRFGVAETAQGLFARTGYTGEDGYEIMLAHDAAKTLWQKLIQAGVAPIGLGARDSLRLEAGLNLYGSDMDETVSPHESNLTWTIDLNDPTRQFIGKSALQAKTVTQQLVGIELTAPGVCRKGMKVTVEGQEGILTSGGFAPTLNRSIGFARIPNGEFRHCTVDIRGKAVPATIVKLPFYKRSSHV